MNRDVVTGFGDEWSRFTQEKLGIDERQILFGKYFVDFPWESIPEFAVGADIGCGSGRWAIDVAPRVSHLICIDASKEALKVTENNLRKCSNSSFMLADVASLPIQSESLDFAYSLGVFHHLDSPERGMQEAIRVLRTGAPLLLYIYYAFDNRPTWYHALWRTSNFLRNYVSKRSLRTRYALSQLLALFVYLPIARICAVCARCGVNTSNWPLSFYREASFYTMRTDALDRFGTRIEHRYSREDLEAVLKKLGLTGLIFSSGDPYWRVVGFKASN